MILGYVIALLIILYNLSILECKFHYVGKNFVLSGGIIFPYWNVNKITSTDVTKAATSIIFPYWNVNTNHLRAYKPYRKYNLSILECK